MSEEFFSLQSLVTFKNDADKPENLCDPSEFIYDSPLIYNSQTTLKKNLSAGGLWFQCQGFLIKTTRSILSKNAIRTSDETDNSRRSQRSSHKTHNPSSPSPTSPSVFFSSFFPYVFINRTEPIAMPRSPSNKILSLSYSSLKTTSPFVRIDSERFFFLCDSSYMVWKIKSYHEIFIPFNATAP